MSNPRILITGGAGFLASHLVDFFIDQKYKVHVIDDLSGGYRSNVNKNAIFHIGSVSDPIFIDSIMENIQFDYIYHFAAYAAEGLSHFIRSFNYTNNLLGSINLINWAVKQKIKCFVFTSSIAVYGSGNPNTLFQEDLPVHPEDPYAIAKYAVELDLQAANQMWDLPFIIFRPHNIYGPRQNIADRYRNVVGIFLNQILQNKQLTIFGDGQQTRQFTYISDIIHPLGDCIHNVEMYNQIFNIGNDNYTSIQELANTLLTLNSIPEFQYSLYLNYQPSRLESEHSHADHKKLNRFYPNYNQTSLLQGLQQTFDWVKVYGSRETPKFKNIELFEKLPPLWI